LIYALNQGADLVSCIVRADSVLNVPVPKAGWLIHLWRKAVDVFVKDAGYQALIGQAFLGGAPLEHLKVDGR
jgi:hypothetical protein